MERNGAPGAQLIWIIPMILSLGGLVVIASMTGWDSHSAAMKQLMWLSISFFFFFGAFNLSLDAWDRLAWPLFIVALLLVALTLVPGVGVTVKGASRWIRLGIMNFQPAEALSFSVMLLLARIYRRNAKQLKALAVTSGLLVICAAILLKQPDFGSLLLLVGIAGAMFVDRYGLVLPLGALTLLVPGFLLIAKQGYRMERLAVWQNPWRDPMGAGYQIIQGLIAFANGGLTGIGINRSQDFLPEVHNDFIFPAMGEQFGLVGTLLLLGAFIVWTVVVCRAYYRALEPRRLLMWGCCVSIILPLLINVGGVTNLIPLSGMPLPFVSYGGTSLVFMWTRVGILARLVRLAEGEAQ